MSRSRAWTSALGLMLLWWCATYGFGSLDHPLVWLRWFPHVGMVVTDALSFLVVLLVSWRLGLFDGALFRLGRVRAWAWLVPPLLVACLYPLIGRDGVPGIYGPSWVLLSLAAGTAATGISEEFGTRGPAMTALLRAERPVVAAVATSVVFGVMHVGNALFGQSASATAWQVLTAGSAGFLWAGARLVTGSLWPGIVLHALSNFLQIASPGPTPQWFQCVVAVFSVVWGLVLIRVAGRSAA
ncbi:CPBP family intramembrane glutamic endopeptidase [Tsukamurella tyrosinosolvens]|uniref:CPBP family intramembrane glutamic endopeptidase n=1 Tax=Tsukamurella tyrosinosolvens TaxID=57704 RepID=UPI000C7F5678|nr:CPBP family intramembrane glutamic endopeptidase [Tsukamurella tyrosinosolvens]AUN39734.1 hypothetical protein ASU32_06645 [Tsukamurella tyrosinosolvens]